MRYLPERLAVEHKSEGVGDSLFESVLYGLREIPNGVSELRELVMNEVLNIPKDWE